MKVVWTRKALSRLEEIEDYIAIDSPGRAIGFVSGLMDQADTLAKFPESGRAVPEDEERLRRELIFEGYRIIYRVENTVVYILSVFEGSRLIRGICAQSLGQMDHVTSNPSKRMVARRDSIVACFGEVGSICLSLNDIDIDSLKMYT